MTEPTGIVQVGEIPAEYTSPADSVTVEFSDFPLKDEIVEALRDLGIETPFPIQALTLPVALDGHDIIGQAKTGTGKTLGFGLPLLNRLDLSKVGTKAAPQALVIVPTRELAVQVARDLEAAGKKLGARIVQIYGGRAFEPQIDALNRGCEVVVGTPGRMLDLLNRKVLQLSQARTVVLDEADEMLDLGFLPDVESLLAATPGGRHTMLFSATMPGAVIAMARRYMSRPTHIHAQDPRDESATVGAVTQAVYRAHALNKVEMLSRILQAEGRGLTIVFTRTKRTAAKVADELMDRGFAAAALHGDLGQGAREQALRAFRSGKVDILVATDVAARGIDVDDVTHVVNYQCPEDEKIYLHRIGRTGRAGKAGTAVTFVDWDDTHRWMLIDKALGFKAGNPVETYHTSDHLYSDLNIPTDVTGVLPRSERTRAGLDAEKIEDLGETGKRTPRGGRSRGGQRRNSDRQSSGRPRRNRQRRRTRGGKPTE
ncbi:DNA helicase [Bowdeniella nasicola]|uniref:RNA helicase n=1 Tax=Bowdeniella nasicola TaxID=208480 RepID=A0A1Q5Q1Q4_9ACTO|nr:DEAD/DEAH box helicase [Bowdeniella nasicola]OKL53635.1 DNA helicase [Bowdeniella nasicola]